MTDHREFTIAEQIETQEITRKGFIGRASHEDTKRAQQLFAINPDQYAAIGKEVREQERKKLMF